MAKSLSEAPITTASARSKLAFGEFARRIDPDAALWYRKGKRGGVWFLRWRNHYKGANYKQLSIGPANDQNDKPLEGLLTFQQAELEARKRLAAVRAEAKAAEIGEPITVAAAVEAYIAERDVRESARKGKKVRSDASRRLARYVLGQAARGKQPAIAPSPLAGTTLVSLKEGSLTNWRAILPATMKAATKQRLSNDLKAALNTAYHRHREHLSPALPAIIKHGLKAHHVQENDVASVARENQILTDLQVSEIISAARQADATGDWEGDLYRLVLVLAATGARFSQCARILVGDAQLENSPRLLVPRSRKGKGAKPPSIPVPIGRDVATALEAITADRQKDAILLERWKMRQISPTVWERVERRPWGSNELTRPWQEVRRLSGMPHVIPYALRHSSIVRGLRANLPIRLVAALHDTSVVMIERHYGRYIADGLEELAAKAVVPLLKPEGGPNHGPL